MNLTVIIITTNTTVTTNNHTTRAGGGQSGPLLSDKEDAYKWTSQMTLNYIFLGLFGENALKYNHLKQLFIVFSNLACPKFIKIW